MARASMAALIARMRTVIGDPAGAATVFSAWQALHVYAVGDQRRPVVANGHFYAVVVAGTSAAVAPTFPVDGGSVIDGTAVWQDQGAVPTGTSAFTDDELQDFLDERAFAVDLATLRGDVVASGSSLVFRAPVRWWEADAVIADASGGELTPDEDTTDALAGRWGFASAQSGTVYVTGRHYDLYGSATAALQAWAAKVGRDFDFATDGQRFDRSQKREGLLAVSREYARKSISPGMRPTWGNATWES